VAREQTTADLELRRQQIKDRLNVIDREHQGSKFPDEIRDEWNSLNSELDGIRETQRELDVRWERLREAAANPEQWEPVEDSNRGRRPSVLTGSREVARSAALRTIDRYESELPADAGDGLVRHVEQRDPLGLDAAYLNAVGDPYYASAFTKILRSPSDAHLRFSARETEAVRAVTEADEARAMNIGTGSAGGFGAPFQLDPSIMISGTGSTNPFRQISRVETITGYEWRGVSSDQVTAHYRAEGTEVADDSPALVQPIVHPQRGDAFVPFSIEVGMDYPNLVTELGKLLADARDQLDAVKFINGVPGSNEPVGILSIGQTGALTTAQRVLTNTTASFALADVWNIKAQVPPRFIDNDSTIVAAPQTLDTVFRFVGGGSTEPPLMPTRDGPVVGLRQASASSMVTTTTTGSRIMIAGDFKDGHMIADRLGVTIEVVPHLFGSGNRYPTGQRGVLCMWRTGAGVVVPNALRYLEVR
jgi:HK97 family phage major capsid protein